MRPYTVHLVVAREITVWALSAEAAALIGLEEAHRHWPECGTWLVSDVTSEVE